MASVKDESKRVKNWWNDTDDRNWWNDTDDRKPKYLEKKPCLKCHSVRHKSHLHWPGVESRPPR